MKTLFVLSLLFLVIGCTAAPADTPPELPADVQAAVDAESAGANAGTAQAIANRARATAYAASQYATAARRSTDDLLNMEGTRIAGQLALAHVTETAVAQQGATEYAFAQMSKTETVTARNATDAHAAIVKTEAANTAATQIAIADARKTESTNGTATRRAESAEGTATRQQERNATATYVAEAPTREAIVRIQSDEDARRAQAQAEEQAREEMSIQLAPYRAAWDMFAFPTFLSLLAVALIAGTFLLLRSGARHLDSLTLEKTNDALTKRVIRLPNGTPVGFLTPADNGDWIIETLPASPQLPAPTQPETPIENPPTLPSEPNADDLLRVNNPLRGDTFISRGTPEENDAQVRKMLALRLLRDAMQYYARRNLDVRVSKIPSYRDLEWSSETWVRAVDSLKPYVIAKSGRGGGTFCAPEYPHLVALYDAVGNNKVVPCPSVAPPLPSPALSALAA